MIPEGVSHGGCAVAADVRGEGEEGQGEGGRKRKKREGRRSSKLQAPSSREAPRTKLQVSKPLRKSKPVRVLSPLGWGNKRSPVRQTGTILLERKPPHPALSPGEGEPFGRLSTAVPSGESGTSSANGLNAGKNESEAFTSGKSDCIVPAKEESGR